MSNFPERIAYWYLRLNGFFVIENFVHHAVSGERRAADLDLLAVRLPHAVERISGVALSNDAWWSNNGLNLERDRLAVITQVKGGGGDVDRAFSADRIRDAVLRVGAWAETDATAVSQALQCAPKATADGWTAIKMTIGPDPCEQALHLPLVDALRFVERRIRENLDRKRRDWNQFADPLIQMIAFAETYALNVVGE